MLHYIAIGASAAVATALLGFLLGSWFPLLPSPALSLIVFLCPPHVFLIATAACEPFDACSWGMFGWVIAANVLLYSLLAVTVWLTRRRRKPVRIAVVAIAAAASAWWVTRWT